MQMSLRVRRLALCVLISGQVLIGNHAMAQDASWPATTEEELRKVITGATLTGEVKAEPPFNFSEFLGPDGKSRGKMIECCRPEQILTKGMSYAGDWTLEKDSLCLTYEGEEEKICWRLQVKGDRFRMVDNKFGRIGEGQIRPGNPDNL
ncbi:hypothetical protein CU102_06405 [Phyllobacterium brassicacearum]|uniref:DUF995 domain-containing protein n=2 Tax=Phyllobacterium brassicacearum TaxID=314235 RepID=A0A2P7BU04_9HYPH|nr:hypothetical protein CU102_06405 [Phyllobacterium brassicacearum]